MKVVIFCGGVGLRLRENSENIPKPLAPIGDAPVVWHLMKYYSHYGHTDFILCLGQKAESIKRFFLNYHEALSRDFVLTDGGHSLQLLGTDYSRWRITFVDTGTKAPVGERLLNVREHLKGEEVFLANYADGLSNVDLPMIIDHFRKSGKTACFVSVPLTQTFHFVETDGDSRVIDINYAGNSDTWINGGYFIFRREIFDYIQPGEDLVDEPFQRLIDAGELITVHHSGFWACMDTFKERQQLEDLWSKGAAPWRVWQTNGGAAATPAAQKDRSIDSFDSTGCL